MAITYLDPINVGANAWRVRWTSDRSSPTYRVFVNGQLVNQTKHTSYVVTLETDEHAVIEVLDVAADIAEAAHEVGMRLMWPSVPATKSYLLEKFNGTWQAVAEIRDDGSKAYEWTTTALADVAHTYRVTPIGDDGNSGTARTLTFSAIHHPDRPAVALTYTKAVSEVVIAAA